MAYVKLYIILLVLGTIFISGSGCVNINLDNIPKECNNLTVTYEQNKVIYSVSPDCLDKLGKEVQNAESLEPDTNSTVSPT